MPLGVIVAVAILCIIVAALTSAQRADDVALARERQLLSRAVVNHGEWSLLRLKSAVQSNASVRAEDINQFGGGGPAAPARLARRFERP